MKLVVISGGLEGQKYEFDGEITIGRGARNDLVVNERPVSLVHCRLHDGEDGAWVQDLGSTNGTWVDGRRIVRVPLASGAVLRVGKSEMKVEVGHAFARKTEPVATLVEPNHVTQVTSRSREELSGSIFGSVTYYLKRKLADGGMGSVYEAEQYGAEGFTKRVAIKTILPNYAKNETFVSSFIAEAKLAAMLVHPNIVQILHLGRHEKGYYIAMEYIDGMNLTSFMMRHWRAKKFIPVDLASFMVSRICRGLEYAHRKEDERGQPIGLVHRDVSPNNIMLTREGEVKLTDFGVAKAARFMQDDSDYLVGSVEYMSPEQADCRTIDGRSDIFSLGLVFYELLTAVRIFQCHGNDIDGTVERVKKAEIPDIRGHRADIPDKVVDILMRCLRKDPDERFRTAGELAHAIESDMYSKGYGPTTVTLGDYLKKLGQPA